MNEIHRLVASPNFINNNMENMIQSLRYKKITHIKAYRLALLDFYKRLGLWVDWKEEV